MYSVSAIIGLYQVWYFLVGFWFFRKLPPGSWLMWVLGRVIYCRPLFSRPQVLTVTNQLIYNSVCHIAWTFSPIDRKSTALDWDMGHKTQENFTLQFLKLHNTMPQDVKDVIPQGFGSRVGRWLGMNSVYFLEEFYGHNLSGDLFTTVILFLVLFTYRSLMCYYLWRGLSSNRWTTRSGIKELQWCHNAFGFPFLTYDDVKSNISCC